MASAPKATVEMAFHTNGEASAEVAYKAPDSTYADSVSAWGKDRRAALRNLRTALGRMLTAVQDDLDATYRPKGGK